jgi:hypothetical protein
MAFFLDDNIIAETKTEVTPESFEQGKKDAWYLLGVSVATYPEETKKILEKFNVPNADKQSMVQSITSMVGTRLWKPFSEAISPLIERVAKNVGIAEGDSTYVEESGWVQALITAVGEIGGGITQTTAANKQLKTEKEKGKTAMTQGVLDIVKLREQRQIEREKSGTKTPLIIGAIVIVLIIAVVVVIVMRRKAK